MYNLQIVIIFVISVGVFCNLTTIGQSYENSSELNNFSNLKLIKVSDICGQTLEETQFLMVSPDYPAKYPSNLNCEITLEGPDCPLYYKFQFIDFDVENSTGCVNDRLEIDQTDALCGEKNGTVTYFVQNGTLKLRFISNESKSGKGYKILVTRIEECLNETEKFPGTVLTSRGGNFNPNFKLCSLEVPENSRHFFLKSPNFPTSMSHLTDYCREGYLQIDGKIICGCKRELNLMSPFFENLKIIRFKSEGLVRNSYSGFLAEVYQDDCPKKVESNPTISSFRNSRASSGLNEKLLYFPNSRDITEVYYFEYPDSQLHRKEREDVNYLETENIDSLLGNNINEYNHCLQWNQFQFDTIFGRKEATLDECRKDSNRIHQEQNCVKFFQRRGFFLSPMYPFFYPGHLNLCYRFLKTPGHCGVKIHFLDFRIGPNEVCSQDYMEIGDKGSFCGTRLWNKMVYLDLEKKGYEDVHFVTTYLRCAQGFKAIFEQIPCQAVTTEPSYPYTDNKNLD
ncbi:hypothetical protein WA026_020255 [Henosepilachna vigintioctopunctata]|uniref:CUB domain-containing protein n=1 Tax=Henosepilachna vigintioctopunctata TaxID=420089 RepID=A0AAW1TX22_9CUCU